jgi:hypothetical protein
MQLLAVTPLEENRSILAPAYWRKLLPVKPGGGEAYFFDHSSGSLHGVHGSFARWRRLTPELPARHGGEPSVLGCAGHCCTDATR